MAQADGVVANGTGSAVRSDINTQYAALWSNHSGSTEPSSGKVAYQFWADTNTNILKIRNSANNAWISLFTLAGGIDVDAASNFNEDVTFTGASSKNAVWDKSDGALEFVDNAKAVFGTGDDLQIYHSGHSVVQNTNAAALLIASDETQVLNNAMSENQAKFIENGAVELYYDNTKRFQTSSDGVDVTGDVTITNTGSNPQLALIAAANGTAEIQFGDASDSVRANIIYACGTAGDKLQFNGYNNTERFNVDSSGNLNIPNDSGKFRLGLGADLQIFHDGSYNKIESSGSTELLIRGNGGTMIGDAAGNKMIKTHDGGATEIYYDGSKKFETTSDGAKVDGVLTITNEFNMTNQGDKYIDTAHLSHTLHFRRINGADTGHSVHCTVASGGLWSADFNDTSDEKLKENIVAIPDGAISKVKQLRPVSFDWKDEDKANNVNGFIAQELKTVLPNLVYGTEYDPTIINESQGIKSAGYSVNTIGIVAHLTKALQEAITKIETLETKVAALEAK